MKILKLTGFLFLITAFATAQSKYDKSIAAVEATYETGDYKKATASLEKFKKKAFKKLGQQNAYTVKYYLLLAKFSLASGSFTEFESNLQLAVSNSLLIDKENSQKHGLLLLEAAQLYAQNGSYRISRNYLNDSKKILEKGAFFNDDTKARWEVAVAEAMTGQGYFREAAELLKGQEKYFSGRAVKQETFVDDKGNLKSRKVPEEELTPRRNDYARLLTSLGNCYGKQGSLRSADSVFVYAASWTKKNLDESSLAYVRNQFYNANVLVENGNEDLPKELEFSRTLNNIKSNHQSSHYLSVEIYEAYLKQLVKEGGAKYTNTKLEYEKMINSSFKGGNIYKARLKAVEFDSKLSKDKTKNLENEANA